MQQKYFTVTLLLFGIVGWSLVIVVWVMRQPQPVSTLNTLVSNTAHIDTSAIWGTDEDIVQQSVGDNQNRYNSKRYGFNWLLGKDFTFMHFPPTEPAKYAARFDRPNPNESIQRNRQTVIGFNTKQYDEITLEVWLNKEPQLTTSSTMNDWIDVVAAHRRVLEQTVVTINGQKVFRATEMDAEAGAYGYYYYFLSQKSLVVLGSTDFSHEEMERFLQTFDFSLLVNN